MTRIDGDVRAETGPLKIGDDWCGYFIRGDECFWWRDVFQAAIRLMGRNPYAAELARFAADMARADERIDCDENQQR